MANIGSGEIRGDVFARDKSRGAKISTCFKPPLRVAHLDHLGQDEGILNRDGQVRCNSFQFPCLSFRAGCVRGLSVYVLLESVFGKYAVSRTD